MGEGAPKLRAQTILTTPVLHGTFICLEKKVLVVSRLSGQLSTLFVAYHVRNFGSLLDNIFSTFYFETKKSQKRSRSLTFELIQREK